MTTNFFFLNLLREFMKLKDKLKSNAKKKKLTSVIQTNHSVIIIINPYKSQTLNPLGTQHKILKHPCHRPIF